MTSVFGNVFRMSGGESVWGNVFVLEDSASNPSQAGWITRPISRVSVSQSSQRVLIVSPQQRVWIARSDNE